MILLIILFFVVGIIAIMFEAVLPFGISAIFGFLVIGASAYIAYLEYGINLAAVYCVMALLIAILVTRLVLRSGLKWMTLRPPAIGAKADSEKTAPLPDPKAGDPARVVAPLRPTGTVESGGRRLAARCATPEIEFPIGASVRLVARDSIYWIVEAAPGESVDG